MDTDDVQVVPVGGAVAPGGTVVDAGPDGILQTLPAGDDEVDNMVAFLDWMNTEPDLATDIQRVDIDLVNPVPLRGDPLAVPQSTLPVTRLCRISQEAPGVETYTENLYTLQPGQIVGYLLNSRRVADGVPGILGAGITTEGLRRPRPEPPTSSCP